MWYRYTLLTICLALLAIFLVWPIALTVSGGFRVEAPDGTATWTLSYVMGVFEDPVLRESLVNSLLVAGSVTLLSLLVALPLALIATRYEFRGKGALNALTLVPLILPPFVGAIGLRHLFGRYGAVNSLLMDAGWMDAGDPFDFLGGARFVGVVIAEVLHLYPIIYLNASAALANLDPALEQAAENLGAGRWTRLRRIILPLILPGVFAGGTIVFIWSFTELGAPLMFDYNRVAPVQIFWGIQDMSDDPTPYALVVVVLVTALALYALGKLVFGKKGHAMTTRAMTGQAARRLTGMSAIPAVIPFLIIIGLALLPHVGVALASVAEPGSWYRSVLPAAFTGEHFRAALTHPLASTAIRNSLLYSSLAMLLDVALGFTIAYLVVRAKVKGAQLADVLAMLPLAVPGLVMAFGYVSMSLHWPFPQMAAFFDTYGWTGLASVCQIKGETPNPIVFLVIAYAVRRLPYIVRSVSAGLEQTSGDLEEAAMNLGASPLYSIRRIVLPLIMANIIAGALLTFSFAMLEVSDSLILAETEAHYPLTKAIYVLFKRLGDGPYVASAMGVWGMALMTVTLVGTSIMLGKKLGAVFRI